MLCGAAGHVVWGSRTCGVGQQDMLCGAAGHVVWGSSTCCVGQQDMSCGAAGHVVWGSSTCCVGQQDMSCGAAAHVVWGSRTCRVGQQHMLCGAAGHVVWGGCHVMSGMLVPRVPVALRTLYSWQLACSVGSLAAATARSLLCQHCHRSPGPAQCAVQCVCLGNAAAHESCKAAPCISPSSGYSSPSLATCGCWLLATCGSWR
jgi:hypothetical protein